MSELKSKVVIIPKKTIIGPMIKQSHEEGFLTKTNMLKVNKIAREEIPINKNWGVIIKLLFLIYYIFWNNDMHITIRLFLMNFFISSKGA